MIKHPSKDPVLDNLIEYYGSDKNLSGYNTVYGELLHNIRDKVTNVLEIGVGSLQYNNDFSFAGNTQHYPQYRPGNSLRVWRDYFPNATIHGVDIEEDCRILENRIETFIFPSINLHLCKQHLFNFKYDIIIDDGDHSAISQLITFKNLAPLLKEGGMYFIEDIGGYRGYEEPDGTWYKPELFIEFKEELHRTASKYNFTVSSHYVHPLLIS